MFFDHMSDKASLGMATDGIFKDTLLAFVTSTLVFSPITGVAKSFMCNKADNQFTPEYIAHAPEPQMAAALPLKGGGSVVVAPALLPATDNSQPTTESADTLRAKAEQAEAQAKLYAAQAAMADAKQNLENVQVQLEIQGQSRVQGP